MGETLICYPLRKMSIFFGLFSGNPSLEKLHCNSWDFFREPGFLVILSVITGSRGLRSQSVGGGPPPNAKPRLWAGALGAEDGAALQSGLRLGSLSRAQHSVKALLAGW